MQDVETGHEWDAEVYHRLSDPQYNVAILLLNKLALRGDETVVDAGCGSGRVTRELLARLPAGKVIGVDLSQNMLDKARQVLSPAFGAQLELVQANLQTFCRPDIADGLFSSMALHFVADRAAMFKNFAATLKPGGWLAAQFVAQQDRQAPFFALMQDVMRRSPYVEHIGDWKSDFFPALPEETVAQLEAAGFADIDVRQGDIDMRFPARDRVEMMRTVALRQPLALLPDDALREAFLTDIMRAVEQAKEQEQPVKYLICRARRRSSGSPL